MTHPTRKILYGLAALAILTSSALAAGDGWRILDVFQRNKAKRIEILIVTGNYVQSRVLAEVIQYATKQPILLLPTGNEKDIMYFLGPKMEALEIEETDYVQLIDFLQPKKVAKPMATAWPLCALSAAPRICTRNSNAASQLS